MKALTRTDVTGNPVVLYACPAHSKLILEKWYALEHADITHTDVPDDYARTCCLCPPVVGAR